MALPQQCSSSHSLIVPMNQTILGRTRREHSTTSSSSWYRISEFIISLSVRLANRLQREPNCSVNQSQREPIRASATLGTRIVVECEQSCTVTSHKSQLAYQLAVPLKAPSASAAVLSCLTKLVSLELGVWIAHFHCRLDSTVTDINRIESQPKAIDRQGLLR